MICPACRATLGKINSAGEPLIRNRGLILKAEGVVAICPKCGGDVAFSPDLIKALQSRWLLFFKHSPHMPELRPGDVEPPGGPDDGG